jgi:hypothetical protein
LPHRCDADEACNYLHTHNYKRNDVQPESGE